MSVLDDMPDQGAERASRQIGRLRGQLDDAKRELAAVTKERDDAERVANVALSISDTTARKMSTARAAKGQRKAEAWAILSDHHYGKRITPSDVGGRNEYTPDIAQERLASLLEGLQWQVESWRGKPGYDVRGLTVMLGGDMIENTLHEENFMQNTMTPTEEVMWATHHLSGWLDAASSIAPMRVVCIVGNHGRTTRRQPASDRTRYSYESLLYDGLRRALSHRPIEWVIPRAAEAIVTSLGHKIRCIHGDQIRAGNAAGGPIATIARNVLKLDAEEHCAATAMGHFHQFLYSHSPGFIVNNSLCGWDGYAKNVLLAPYSPPAQVAFLVDERDGVVMPKQIRCYDRAQRERMGT